ncbi:MAG: AI-2E family transporter [Rhodospirillales bacterium]|nr:MAG: AI-2E family transporter [Rhodospirillales bacterium]
MTQNTGDSQQNFSRNAIDAAIKIGLVGLLAYLCLYILSPFIMILMWAGIVATAMYPLCLRLARLVGGRRGLSATLLTLAAVVVLLGPIGSLGVLFVKDSQALLAAARDGTLQLPMPDDSVRDWPVIGAELHEFWTLAATNVVEAVEVVEPQIKWLGEALASGAATTGFALLQFLIATIIAGIAMTRAAAVNRGAVALAERLVAGRGESLVRMVEGTVRTVTRGILGTAVIQTVFAGFGMIVAGIPGAGLWTFLCLLLSVVQLGPGLVLIATAIYMFAEASTLAAVIYLVWVVPVMLMDNVLKPLLMGRGAAVPVLVIFLGVVGGTIGYGLIGIFVGPVVLAVGYTLFASWLDTRDEAGAG